MRSRLLGLITGAALVLTAVVSAPGSASAAPDDCQVVSTATSSTDGASYPAGPGKWFTLHRTITSTTELCGTDYTTTIVLGHWLPELGTGDPDNIAFARAKAAEAERVRLERLVKKLEKQIRHLKAARVTTLF